MRRRGENRVPHFCRSCRERTDVVMSRGAGPATGRGRGEVREMMRGVVIGFILICSTSALGVRLSDLNDRHVNAFPKRERAAKPTGGGSQNVSYHNGPVIHQARVIPVFWGPTNIWGTNGSPSARAQSIVNFFVQFGTTSQYNVITQYYDLGGAIRLSNLTSTYWIDNSTPPANVTDSVLRGEVVKVLPQVGIDANTVYEVFLSPFSYASFGSATSCGGPNVQFCAYHGNFSYLGVDIKYASLPYPSCGGCQWPNWTSAQNFEHFACHETREAVTDPDGNAWFDRFGNEADDKCAW